MQATTVLSTILIGIFTTMCASVPSESERPPIRVMSYNIRLDLESDGANAWRYRKAAVAHLIRRADIVGLQEALPGQLRDLEAMLPELGQFGDGRDADRGGEHCAILYRKDRFEVLRHDTFWLSETPEVAGSMGWDAAYRRITTWGQLRDRITGAVFVHVNTHFDNQGAIARRESARLVVRRIEQTIGEREAVILTGDLNTTSATEPYETIVGAGFVDAIDISNRPHQGPTSTWNGFGEVEPDRRIDFIFVRGPIEVDQHAILSDRLDAGYPSDHFPVLAEIRVENRR